ncbi:MAG: type II 3-dehydroquinate dehydratase [Opitutales bacterium]|nr:type II 3-dehydroquinate dehydratase [Opitutales bacterium]
MKPLLAVLNGPNLDRLGKREPGVYGSATLEDLHSALRATASSLGADIIFFQTNHEGELLDKIGELADGGCAGAAINPGAWTHTSVALRDAIAGSGMPFVEVHISNVHKREPFRHHSYTAGVCDGVISGLGQQGYHFALEYLVHQISREKPPRSPEK